MDIENLIKETFTAHERDAPEGDAVLAAARRRIDRRGMPGRPLAVAAGVVVLTLAAVTVVAVSRPADQTGTAAPPPTSGKAPAEPTIEDLTMPYTLGWLPPGKVEYVARRINIGAMSDAPDAKPLYGGEYMMNVTANGQVLNVDVQQFRMVEVDDAAFKSGPGNPVTIKGQRGVESAHSGGPGGYELYVAHPDGGSMYVNVAAADGSTAPAKRLAEIGRRVAENIRFPGTTAVTPLFGLRTPLPDGMRICAFDVGAGFTKGTKEAAPSTYYELGTCDVTPPVTVGTLDMTGRPSKPGRPVQGHQTRYFDEGGYRTLMLLDAVGETPVAVAGSVPQADLYAIANHLVLPR